MHKLYNYYGLEIYFDDKASLPITVYAARAERISKAIIYFKDGLLQPHQMQETTNPLDEQDQHSFHLILEKNISEMIKFWIDVFIYMKPLQEEIIKTKLV
jgi:hypothetical protein